MCENATTSNQSGHALKWTKHKNPKSGIHWQESRAYANVNAWQQYEQESPAIADKPARRKSLPKIAPIRRAYNVVADKTGLSSSFV